MKLSDLSTFRNLAYMVLCGSLLGANERTATAGLINQYDVITIGNTTTSNDIEGPALIGGNATLATVGLNGGSQVGVNLATVLGNLNGSSLNVNNGGNLAVGGKVNAQVNYNGGGHLVNLSTSQVSSLSAAIQEIKTDSTGFAQMYAADSGFAKNTLDSSNSSNPNIHINYVDSKGNAIVSIAASALTANSNANFGITFGVPQSSISSLVIDVTGGPSVSIPGNEHFDGFANNSYLNSHLIWNFTDATSLSVGANLHGVVILAPNADVSTSVSLDGAVWANSLQAGGEIHYPLYAGNLPSLSLTTTSASVPEPSTLVMGSIAAALLAGYSLRSRKRA
jgi:choice-of-anchor A domain-containing protein